MIHNCWVMAMGNRHDMAETAEWLAPFDAAVADVYAARSGADRADIVKWMDAETFMSGSTAVERGFASALLAADQVTTDEDAKAEERSVRSEEHTSKLQSLMRSSYAIFRLKKKNQDTEP